MLSSLHDALVAVFDESARCVLSWESKSLARRYGAGASGEGAVGEIEPRLREVRIERDGADPVAYRVGAALERP